MIRTDLIFGFFGTVVVWILKNNTSLHVLFERSPCFFKPKFYETGELHAQKFHKVKARKPKRLTSISKKGTSRIYFENNPRNTLNSTMSIDLAPFPHFQNRLGGILSAAGGRGIAGGVLAVGFHNAETWIRKRIEP